MMLSIFQRMGLEMNFETSRQWFVSLCSFGGSWGVGIQAAEYGGGDNLQGSKEEKGELHFMRYDGGCVLTYGPHGEESRHLRGGYMR